MSYMYRSIDIHVLYVTCYPACRMLGTVQILHVLHVGLYRCRCIICLICLQNAEHWILFSVLSMLVSVCVCMCMLFVCIVCGVCGIFFLGGWRDFPVCDTVQMINFWDNWSKGSDQWNSKVASAS